jgi:hypothetical protein
MRWSEWRWLILVLRLILGIGTVWAIVAFSQGRISGRLAAGYTVWGGALSVLPLSRIRVSVWARVLRMAVVPATAAVVQAVLVAVAPTDEARDHAWTGGLMPLGYLVTLVPLHGWQEARLERIFGQGRTPVDPNERLRMAEAIYVEVGGRRITDDIWAGYVQALRETRQYERAVREFEGGLSHWANSPRFAEALDAAVASAKYARGASGGDDLLVRTVTECPGTSGAGIAAKALVERAQAQQTTHET